APALLIAPGASFFAVAFIVLGCVGTGFVCCTTRFPPRKGGRVLDIRVFKSPSYTLLVLGAGFVGLGL
ncbi:hypothetical protein GYMLUDRAFT_94663, partial [Collybiopsis luxurians FD-317 M1]